jgi:hypothetical protein
MTHTKPTDYASWRAAIEKLNETQEIIESLEPRVEAWRPFDPVVPLLYDALRKELAALIGPAKGVAEKLAKVELNPAAGAELGQALVPYVQGYKRLKTLWAAYQREQARAEKENPELAGGAATDEG